MDSEYYEFTTQLDRDWNNGTITIRGRIGDSHSGSDFKIGDRVKVIYPHANNVIGTVVGHYQGRERPTTNIVQAPFPEGAYQYSGQIGDAEQELMSFSNNYLEEAPVIVCPRCDKEVEELADYLCEECRYGN